MCVKLIELDRTEIFTHLRFWPQQTGLRWPHPHGSGSDDVGGRRVELTGCMTASYIELRQHLEDRLTQFGREMPGLVSGFARLHKKAVEDGASNAKVKEMMALAVSIAVNVARSGG